MYVFTALKKANLLTKYINLKNSQIWHCFIDIIIIKNVIEIFVCLIFLKIGFTFFFPIKINIKLIYMAFFFNFIYVV